MAGHEILLVPSGEGYRCAEILKKKPLKLRWVDSGEEESLDEQPKDARVVSDESLLYDIARNRDEFIRKLSEPEFGTELACRVLQESKRILSLHEIKNELISNYLLPKNAVELGLKTALMGLRSRPNVSETSDSSDAGSALESPPNDKVKKKMAKGVKNSIIRFEWSEGEPSTPRNGNEVAEKPLDLSLALPTKDSNQGIDSQLLHAINGSELPSAVKFEDYPFQVVSHELGLLDDKTVTAWQNRFTTANRFDLASLLLATPRSCKPLGLLLKNWPNDPSSATVLGLALAWVLEGREDTASIRLLNALEQSAATLPLPMIQTCLVALISSSGKTTKSLLSLIASVPATAIEAALRETDIPAILRAVSDRPLCERSILMWAAWRVKPSFVRDISFWPVGVSLEELESLALRSPDSRVFDDTWIQQQVALPVILDAIRNAERRPAVGRLLSLPQPLFALAPVDALAAAIQRAARAEEVMGALLAHLTDADRVLALTAELEQAQSRLNNALLAEELARQDATEARKAETRSFERAATAEREQISASQRELRQAQIDAMRVLAEAIAQVARLGSNSSSQDALQTLTDVALHQGITAIGPVGAVVDYEVGRHEFLGSNPPPSVEICEVGFQLADPEGNLILRRAAVVSPRP